MDHYYGNYIRRGVAEAKTTTIMDINYETNSSFPIFSLVEHPLPPVSPSINVEDSENLPWRVINIEKGGEGNLQLSNLRVWICLKLFCP